MTTPHCPENGGSPVDRVQREPERDGVDPNGPERVAAGTGSGRGDGPERDGAAAVGRESAGAGLRVQRRRLLDWVRGQLVGPAGSGWLRGSPVERYPAGVLHPVDPAGWGMTGLDPAQPEKDGDEPRHAPAGRPEDPREAHGSESAAVPDDEEDDDAPVGAEGAPGGVAARPVGRRRYVPPSSVGVSFYVRGDARLRVTRPPPPTREGPLRLPGLQPSSEARERTVVSGRAVGSYLAAVARRSIPSDHRRGPCRGSPSNPGRSARSTGMAWRRSYPAHVESPTHRSSSSTRARTCRRSSTGPSSNSASRGSS